MDNMEKEKETQQTEAEQETCSCPENQPAPEAAEAEAAEAEAPQPKEDWKEQYQQLNDKYIRVLAEYDNYRKRSQKERDSVFSDAQAMTVEQLLPVLDNLDRALEQKCADEEYQKGVELIAKQFKEALEKMGVTEIAAQDQPFDPRFHDAVMHIEQEGLPENTVSLVMRKGYIMGEKVIRHAMVQVAN